MQTIQFGKLLFEIKDGKIALRPIAGRGERYGFNAVQVEGRNRPTHIGIKLDNLPKTTDSLTSGANLTETRSKLFSKAKPCA